MSSDAIWGTVVGLLMVVIIGLSIAIYHYRRESQKYQVANTNGEGEELQATSQENQVSNTTLDDIELGVIGDATDTAGATTGVARDAGSAAIETTDKKEEITMKFQDEKHDSNDSSDESENTFVVHSSQRSIQSPLAIYNDLKRRFSLSFAAGAVSAAGQTTTYIPGVTSGDKNNNNNDGAGTNSDNSNGKGKSKGLKENLLLSSSKNSEAKEKASNVRARQSSMPAPSACRITRYHARLPSKIFLENKLKRLSITTANKTLNGDEDVIDVYSVSGKEKQGESGDVKENKKQNEKKQDGKNKIENGGGGKPANNNNNNNEKPFPKITIVTNVSSLGKADKGIVTPLISTPQTTIINPTPISPVNIVTPSGARTRDSVEDEELNEENVVSLRGIMSGVVAGIDRRRRSSTNSFSLSSGYSSSPDLAETLNELPSNGSPTRNDVLINNILSRKSESETKNNNNGGGGIDVNGKDVKTEKRSNNQYVFEDRKNSTHKQTIKTGKNKAKANGKVGKSNKPKELTSIVTQKQHGERQGRARKESSIGRGSPLRRQRERRVGLPKRVKSPLVGSSQRNSRNNSRNNSRRNSRNSITLGISNDFDIDDGEHEHSSVCDGWDRTQLPRVAAQPILVQSPFYNTGNDKSSKKMMKKSEIMSSKTPVVEISKKFQLNARSTNGKTDKMDCLGRVPRTTRSVTPKKCKCHQDCNHTGKNSKPARRNTVRGAGTGGNGGKKGTGNKKVGKNQNGKSKNGESKSHRQSVSLSPNRAKKSKGKKENLVDFKKQAKRMKAGVNDENNGNLNRPQWF